MVYTVSNQHKWTRLAGLWLSAMFAADIPMALSLITSNVGGFTKKATVSGMMVSVFLMFYVFESRGRGEMV